MLQTAFEASCMNRTSVFEWHKRFNIYIYIYIYIYVCVCVYVCVYVVLLYFIVITSSLGESMVDQILRYYQIVLNINESMI